MVNVLLSHDVRDFESWKKAFDEGEAFRTQNGVKTHSVFTDYDNPNRVTVHTEFPSVDAVNGMLANPQLKAEMERSGVVSAPEVRILNKH